MKKILIAFLLLSVIINKSKAQDTDFKKPIIQAEKQVYEVTRQSAEHKIVNNSTNHLFKDKIKDAPPDALHWQPKDAVYDKDLIEKIFYDVFSEKQLKKIAGTDMNSNFNIFFNVDPKEGDILEMFFSFQDHIAVKPVELEQIESRLKKEIKFKLNTRIFKNYKYISANCTVNFKRLADHSPNAVY